MTQRPDITVDSLQQLATIWVSTLQEGENAWVDSEASYWVLRKNSGIPVGPNVIAPLPGSPSAGGTNARWIRLELETQIHGDVTGSLENAFVVGIKGIPIEAGLPVNGDSLVYNSATGEWEYAVVGGGGGSPTGPASNDLGGLYPGPTVVAIQGSPVSSSAPVIGDTLVWDGIAWSPSASTSQQIQWSAACDPALSVGDLVCVDTSVISTLTATKVDITQSSKMPSIGIVSSKISPVSCLVVSTGLVPLSGLIPGATYFASATGSISSSPPLSPVTGSVFVQAIGVALTSDLLLVQLPSTITERVA